MNYLIKTTSALTLRTLMIVFWLRNFFSLCTQHQISIRVKLFKSPNLRTKTFSIFYFHHFLSNDIVVGVVSNRNTIKFYSQIERQIADILRKCSRRHHMLFCAFCSTWRKLSVRQSRGQVHLSDTKNSTFRTLWHPRN